MPRGVELTARSMADVPPHLQTRAESRLGAVMAGGIMLSMGTLAITTWLAALDASGLAQAKVRPSPAAPCNGLLHAPTPWPCIQSPGV